MIAKSLRLFRLVALLCVAWISLAASARADTYAQWKARVFTTAEQNNPAISNEGAAPANDGVTNLEKFAFDLDPHTNGAFGRPTASIVLGYNDETGDLDIPLLGLTYRYPYYNYTPENITYIPEVSANLSDPNGWMRGPNVIAYFDAHIQRATAILCSTSTMLLAR